MRLSAAALVLATTAFAQQPPDAESEFRSAIQSLVARIRAGEGKDAVAAKIRDQLTAPAARPWSEAAPPIALIRDLSIKGGKASACIAIVRFSSASIQWIASYDVTAFKSAEWRLASITPGGSCRPAVGFSL